MTRLRINRVDRQRYLSTLGSRHGVKPDTTVDQEVSFLPRHPKMFGLDISFALADRLKRPNLSMRELTNHMTMTTSPA